MNKVVLFAVIAIFAVGIFNPTTDYTHKPGCEVIVHSGVTDYTQWSYRKSCRFRTREELKQQLATAANKAVVIGHGRVSFTSKDTVVGGVATYSDIRAFKRPGQQVAVYSCRSWPTGFSKRVEAHKPFMEKGILVWVQRGETLMGLANNAYDEAFPDTDEWISAW